MISSDSLIVLSPRRREGRAPRAGEPSSPVPVRLSPRERERVKAAARVNHQTVSDFIRDAVVTAASDCLEPDS